MENKGFFITFEGGEGCGKTTQINFFVNYLKEHNVNFIQTREPGGIQACEDIRKIILNPKSDIGLTTEILLFSASRAELVRSVIQPALDEGKLVVCDRFYDSHIVYQGMARKYSVRKIKQITKIAVGDLKPNITIFLRIEPKLAFERKGGADKNDRIEMMGLDFHKKILKGYDRLAKQESERFLVIDASQSKEKVFADILIGLKEKGFSVDE